ncbi:MAG: hypothetical protein SGPRY_014274 [Prymnesium sp.]
MLRLAACALPAAALAVHEAALGSLTAEVNGRSMHPTFNASTTRDRIVLNRFAGSIQRGDVIVLRSPSESSHLLIKRVVGLEGDSIVSKNGESTSIPRGQMWVEGDNKSCSLDSRHFGPVDTTLTEARVAAKVGQHPSRGALQRASLSYVIIQCSSKRSFLRRSGH